MARILCLLVALFAARPLRAAAPIAIEVQARALRPGEVVVFTIDVPEPADDVRLGLFGRTIAAYRVDGHRWQALAGIDLDQRPGSYIAEVEAIKGQDIARASRTLVIVRRVFPTRTLRVAPDYVNPPPDVQARIEREQQFTREVYAHSAPVRLWTAPFLRPVPHVANSSFGTRSVFNGERRNPHAGTDFLSPLGTPILAPSRGRIVCARDLFFTGNTVIIDHGLGIFSLLAHLSRIDVTEGQEIDAGAHVGLVGATGRVTGPHLHWAMAVSGARVDPLSLVDVLAK